MHMRAASCLLARRSNRLGIFYDFVSFVSGARPASVPCCAASIVRRDTGFLIARQKKVIAR
jgi:hypothetical protein